MNQKRKLQIELDLMNNDYRYTFHVPKNVKSAVWNHFQIVKCDGIVENFARCIHCKELLTYSPKGGTGSLLRHTCTRLGAKSPKSSAKATALDGACLDAAVRNPKRKKLAQNMKDEVVNQQLRFITQDLKAPNIMDGTGFKALGQALINIGAEYGKCDIDDVLLSWSTLMRNVIPAKYFELKSQLEHRLAANKLAFSIDIWRDDFTRRCFLTLTAHYIDDAFELQANVLGTREFVMGQPTSDTIYGFVIEILNEFGVTERFNQGVIVTANDAHTVTAFKNSNRLPCASHNLSLIVEEIFENEDGCCRELIDLIEDCKKLFCYFEHSELNTILTEPLMKHDKTRCHSLCVMLSSIFSMYNEIQQLLAERNEWHKLTGINLSLLEHLLDFLQPFKECAQHLSETNQVTIHEYCLWYEKLMKCCRPQVGEREEIAALRERTKVALQKHFKMEAHHYIALFLNPPYKKLQFLAEEQRQKIYAAVKSLLGQLKKRQEKSTNNLGKFEVIQLDHETRKSKGESEQDTFAEFKDDYVGHQIVDGKEQIDIEIDTYVAMNISACKVLDFWKSSSDLPLLQMLAKQILNIPASCTLSERKYGTSTGSIFGDKQTKLSSENIDQILFLNRNTQEDEISDLRNEIKKDLE